MNTAVPLEEYTTVGYIQRLRRVNFTEEQAQVVADILEHQAKVIEEQRVDAKELATKGDVREAELRLQKEIEEVKSALQMNLKNLEIKIMAMYGAGFLILFGILAKGFHWI